MLKLLHLIFLGHFHKWKIIKEVPLNITSKGEVVARGSTYNLQCEGCGNLKTYNDIDEGNY